MSDEHVPATIELTDDEERFCQAFVKWHGMEGRAYREVWPDWGSKPSALSMAAARLAARPEIKARCAQLQNELMIRARSIVPAIIAKAKQIIEADPAELSRVDVRCCRWCHGIGHRYQFTEREYEAKWLEWAQKVEEAAQRGARAPNAFEDGGLGFNPQRPPHPECPECGGRGVQTVVLADTESLSPGAAALYQGAEQTKYGIKILMQDQQKWAEHILRIAGAFVERREVSGPDGGPQQHAVLAATSNLTAADLTRAYADMVKA